MHSAVKAPNEYQNVAFRIMKANSGLSACDPLLTGPEMASVMSAFGQRRNRLNEARQVQR